MDYGTRPSCPKGLCFEQDRQSRPSPVQASRPCLALEDVRSVLDTVATSISYKQPCASTEQVQLESLSSKKGRCNFWRGCSLTNAAPKHVAPRPMQLGIDRRA
eukprot:6182956-Pleurochrysis_carterae.AAC.2